MRIAGFHVLDRTFANAIRIGSQAPAVLLCLSCLSVPAQSIKSNIEQYAARCKLERPAALKKAKKDLVELSKKRIDREGRKARAEQLNQEIADLENPLKPYHGELIHFFEVKVGDIGWFDKQENDRRNYFRYETKAFQIVNRTAALIRISLASFTAPGLSNEGKIVWVSGIDTSKLENGGDVDLSGLIAVTGNHSYETSNGTNTVLALAIIDPSAYKDLFTRKGDKRTWTSKSGKFTTEAIITRFENGRVVITGLDGKVMKVRLDDLSDEDRKYSSDQIKGQAKPK